jgi:hypothetical protein
MWQPQHRISEGADHPGMAYLCNAGEPSVPQIAALSGMAPDTKDVSADVVRFWQF